MTKELAKVYEPKAVEAEITERWLAAGAFDADPADPRPRYCIVIPPPNVTDALHLGHALNNTLQDVLVRWRRMGQFNTLWMPGTDHAGIATQTVVDKRLKAEGQPDLVEYRRLEDAGKDGRRQFVAKVQAWKDEYEALILGQLKSMGCSCDWRRTRFTMDEVCAAAVRAAFFKLFADGLIYRGKRLVNWDVATQTVLADDEVEYEEVQGHFWYLKYPLVEPVVVPGVAGVSPASNEGVSPASNEGVPPSGEAIVDKRQGRYLPHWTQSGATYTVTFRLADSVAAEVAEAWRRERDEIVQRAAKQGRSLTYHERMELHALHSARVESYLDAGRGCCALKNPGAAEVVHYALKHFDGDRYELIAWSVMPNHVHAILRPLGTNPLKGIVHSWKSFTAKEINRVLGRQGPLWMEEYYDHLIRDEEDLHNQIHYVLYNPTKADLKDWPWCGVRQEYRGQDAHGARGQDGRDTRRQDACDTIITHVTVATTRPETMLGDTAVAMNPADPRAKYLLGKKVRLPIAGRVIPIIADEHVVLPNPDSDDEKARYSTGFLKVTPAHDPDDYAIGQRHGLPVVNVMAPDGTISDSHGWDDCSADAQFLLGMDRFEARQAIVEWFRTENLLEDVRPYTHQVGHSYRSHVPIEPYLSDQWYIAVRKPIPDCGLRIADRGMVDEGGFLNGTDVPATSLAGLALAPVLEGRVKFTPSRYANTYRAWLESLRDWPISRQLWWGHQIPIWYIALEIDNSDESDRVRTSSPEDHLRLQFERRLNELSDSAGLPRDNFCCRTVPENFAAVYVCPRTHQGDTFLRAFEQFVESWECEETVPGQGTPLAQSRLTGFPSANPDSTFKLARMVSSVDQDEDVLDTWFSSALWPFSTMGWPKDTPELKKYYPGDVLCTDRGIITLWISRMVMMGQYCMGDIPFSDVLIHATILDGEGRKMSKSLGNGIDPLDIIDSHGTDAMRFTLVSMTTQTQDVRMPVEEMTLPGGQVSRTSPKFDAGRNFCNKLWNAARFTMTNLQGQPPWGDIRPGEDLTDAWILSRLNGTIRDATGALEGFRFNELAECLYHFLWDEFCDWYLEIAKARINSGDAVAKAILAHCLDVLLRLLHPIIPFITETLWAQLNEVAPVRGPADEHAEPLLARAAWPRADARAINEKAEKDFELLADLVRQVRNVRSQHNVPPGKKLTAIAEATGPAAELITGNAGMLTSQAGLAEVTVSPPPAAPPIDAAAVAAGGVKLYVLGLIDRAAERQRLAKQAEMLRRGVAGIEGKLTNADFLAKAPPAVVQGERQRLQQLQADLAAVEKSLAAMK